MRKNRSLRCVGENIKTRRLEKGLSQSGLAAALGVTAQAVSKWENGQSMPDPSKLPELAALFETSIDVIFAENAKD